MRVGSRRRWMFWSRVITTGLGFLIAMALIAFAEGTSGAGWLFSFLTFCAFWFSLLQGVRLAAGNIADEKREGTLGLLFLTDLKPWEIILGKLAAVAIPLIQPFLSFLPALTITILL